MHIKNVTLALIAALIYEVLLKLGRIVIPTAFYSSAVTALTSILFFIVSIIIILFVVFFYGEEKVYKTVRFVLQILIIALLVQFLVRLPFAGKIMDYQAARVARELIGLLVAFLFFALMVVYKRVVPAVEKSLQRAAFFLTIMLGIGVIKNLSSFIVYMRFVFSGRTIEFSTQFYDLMFVLFLITHLSIIWFLYQYYRFKVT